MADTTLVDIKPSRFVKVGTEIEAMFFGEDGVTKEWYSGEVIKVHRLGVDKNGGYVVCHVEYDDGEIVEDSIFYDKDFELQENTSTSEDLWRLKGTMTVLLRYFIMNTKYLEQLNAEILEVKNLLEDLDVFKEEEDNEEDEGSEMDDQGNDSDDASEQTHIHSHLTVYEMAPVEKKCKYRSVLGAVVNGFTTVAGYILGVSIGLSIYQWSNGKSMASR